MYAANRSVTCFEKSCQFCGDAGFVASGVLARDARHATARDTRTRNANTLRSWLLQLLLLHMHMREHSLRWRSGRVLLGLHLVLHHHRGRMGVGVAELRVCDAGRDACCMSCLQTAVCGIGVVECRRPDPCADGRSWNATRATHRLQCSLCSSVWRGRLVAAAWCIGFRRAPVSRHAYLLKTFCRRS